MLIWGSRNVARTIDQGTFACPACGEEAPYERVRAQRHGHVYWIPLFAMGDAVEYVECRWCSGTYDPEVLTAASDMQDRARAKYEDGMLAVMAAMSVADGKVEDVERRMMQDVQQALTGHPLSDQLLDAALLEAERSSDRLEGSLADLALFLNERGKEMVLKAALSIAAADGHLDEREGQRIGQIAQALGVTRAHLKGLVAEFARG